jgi:predicted AAA+ superfamily ATPase
MFSRKLYPELLSHLPKRQVTVITGLRRVGKSTLVKQLIQDAKTENKCFFDLERIENRMLFSQNSYREIERSIEATGFDFSKPGVIALDEIQLVKNSSSIIKALYDDYGTKFIVTGSSSFYMKNQFSESLAGRKRIFELFPLDFEEFIHFKNKSTKAFKKESFNKILTTFYDIYKSEYEEYLTFGGFPEVVLTAKNTDKTEILRDILNSHIELDIRLLGDMTASDILYKMIHLLANRVGSKIDYTKIGSLIGIDRRKVKEYLLLLEHTYLIRPIKPLVSGIDREITKQEKIYFTDNGLLNLCGQISSGLEFENSIANQLMNIGEVNYFEKSSGTEIDFILNKNSAFEVKETPSPSDLQTLKKRAKPINMTETNLIGKTIPPSGFKDFIWGGNIY